MFAFTCAKANGTHLGTCIDRFYFGSCCKIDDEPDIFPQDNSIDDGTPARPFVTTSGPIESNDIPAYVSRPKPIAEKKPLGTQPVEVNDSLVDIFACSVIIHCCLLAYRKQIARVIDSKDYRPRIVCCSFFLFPVKRSCP